MNQILSLQLQSVRPSVDFVRRVNPFHAFNEIKRLAPMVADSLIWGILDKQFKAAMGTRNFCGE